MGTNFYWRQPACAHCGRADNDLHVGKQSGGWSFLFRGYPHTPGDDGVTSPVGFAVATRADWRRVFDTVPGRLVNEYGATIPDPLAWLAEREPPSSEQVRWEDDQYGRYGGGDWRCPERFRFSPSESS